VSAVKVVDASALAALLLAEPEAGLIAERLAGARLAAPALLDFELADICQTKMRRQPSQREALRGAFRLAHRLRIETVAVDRAAMLDLAEATGLTAYDASYLWLARALGAELVTLDRTLAAALGMKRAAARVAGRKPGAYEAWPGYSCIDIPSRECVSKYT
jgi:predicted nucleic acid-binding protein